WIGVLVAIQDARNQRQREVREPFVCRGFAVPAVPLVGHELTAHPFKGRPRSVGQGHAVAKALARFMDCVVTDPLGGVAAVVLAVAALQPPATIRHLSTNSFTSTPIALRRLLSHS